LSAERGTRGGDQPFAPRNPRSALVLGATGLVGGHCVDLLLEDDTYAAVAVVGRRPLPRKHPKLVQYVIELNLLTVHRAIFEVDDVFCCLGTTIRKAGSREAFRRVDIDYSATAGRLAAAASAEHFLVVSALGADPRSRIPYNRAKGEMEEALLALPLVGLWIFRPSLLRGRREEFRPGEKFTEILVRPVSPLLRGPLRRYRPIQARKVAAAMVLAAQTTGPGRIVESEEMNA
jgi:uncharacterized protein YbjT (DUF2867 family)